MFPISFAKCFRKAVSSNITGPLCLQRLCSIDTYTVDHACSILTIAKNSFSITVENEAACGIKGNCVACNAVDCGSWVRFPVFFIFLKFSKLVILRFRKIILTIIFVNSFQYII